MMGVIAWWFAVAIVFGPFEELQIGPLERRREDIRAMTERCVGCGWTWITGRRP